MIDQMNGGCRRGGERGVAAAAVAVAEAEGERRDGREVWNEKRMTGRMNKVSANSKQRGTPGTMQSRLMCDAAIGDRAAKNGNVADQWNRAKERRAIWPSNDSEKR